MFTVAQRPSHIRLRVTAQWPYANEMHIGKLYVLHVLSWHGVVIKCGSDNYLMGSARVQDAEYPFHVFVET